MSKSIYEEALESRSHINAIIQNRKTHLTFEEEIHHLANITQALEQAQKQEKLLQLYKELTTVKEDMLSCSEFVDIEFCALVEVEKILVIQIKELENK